MPWACPIWGIASNARAMAATAKQSLTGKAAGKVNVWIFVFIWT
jgi:hypothetical protein